jgi:transposase
VTDLWLLYGDDLAILSMDQLSLYFQSTLTHVWALRGQTPIVKVTPQRDYIHIYGALDVCLGREVAVTAPQQTSQVTADFLRILLILFPYPHILLLLDRAPWHFGPDIDLLLQENPHLELLYFPPACPDLNPQEHVWDQARDAISHNHTYACFQSLIDDFDTFLNETPFETNFMDKYAPLHYDNSN